MGKGAIALGIVLVILGIWLCFKTKIIWSGITFIIIGLALIAFWKEESKIEERKDLKIKKSK